MANPEHLAILKQGVEIWNKWRKDNPSIEPDISNADLRGSSLQRADLNKVKLRGADLSGADLWGNIKGTPVQLCVYNA
jgi:uncharacterized protein YjbI with pentapeptide repeats